MRARRDYWALVIAYQSLHGKPMPEELIAEVRSARKLWEERHAFVL